MISPTSVTSMSLMHQASNKAAPAPEAAGEASGKVHRDKCEDDVLDVVVNTSNTAVMCEDSSLKKKKNFAENNDSTCTGAAVKSKHYTRNHSIGGADPNSAMVFKTERQERQCTSPLMSRREEEQAHADEEEAVATAHEERQSNGSLPLLVDTEDEASSSRSDHNNHSNSCNSNSSSRSNNDNNNNNNRRLPIPMRASLRGLDGGTTAAPTGYNDGDGDSFCGRKWFVNKKVGNNCDDDDNASTTASPTASPQSSSVGSCTSDRPQKCRARGEHQDKEEGRGGAKDGTISVVSDDDDDDDNINDYCYPLQDSNHYGGSNDSRDVDESTTANLDLDDDDDKYSLMISSNHTLSSHYEMESTKLQQVVLIENMSKTRGLLEEHSSTHNTDDSHGHLVEDDDSTATLDVEDDQYSVGLGESTHTTTTLQQSQQQQQQQRSGSIQDSSVLEQCRFKIEHPLHEEEHEDDDEDDESTVGFEPTNDAYSFAEDDESSSSSSDDDEDDDDNDNDDYRQQRRGGGGSYTSQRSRKRLVAL